MTRDRLNRREFLAASSCTLAGAVLVPRIVEATSQTVVPRRASQSADTFLRARMAVNDIQKLAVYAIDAAHGAGAEYADIRIAERHLLDASQRRVTISTSFTYGVRALIGGSWGFVYGRAPTADAVAQCAMQAAASAHAAAQISSTRRSPAASSLHDVEWIPAPVARGRWQTPISIDPFTVPIQQHDEWRSTFEAVVRRIPETEGFSMYEYQWDRETRVFAATTGSLVTQTLYRTLPRIDIDAQMGRNRVSIHVPDQEYQSAGYERLLAPDLLDRVVEIVERMAPLARLPLGTMDVGRYPMVVDGCTMGTISSTVLGPALELDRVVTKDTSSGETSRLSLDLLGSSIASPLLTVRANRAMPSVTAVQWDDEGYTPREHTLVKNGVLMDYHTSGQTVANLQSWYAQHGMTFQSNGCAVAPDARDVIATRSPHLVMDPGTTTASLEHLCREMGRGVLVLGNIYMSTDEQLRSGNISSFSSIFEVSQGKIVRRLENNGVQFMIAPLLKGLTAIGDATSVCAQSIRTSKGMPWVRHYTNASAPAALFKQVDLVSTRF